MKIAKIISVIAFISNIYLSVRSYQIFSVIRPTFRELQVSAPFPWPLFLDLIFAIGCITYWLYLGKKEKKGEKVKFALLISIALLLFPFFITFLLPGLIYFKSIYDYLGKVNP